jgi:hypothetical protein
MKVLSALPLTNTELDSNRDPEGSFEILRDGKWVHITPDPDEDQDEEDMFRRPAGLNRLTGMSK